MRVNYTNDVCLNRKELNMLKRSLSVSLTLFHLIRTIWIQWSFFLFKFSIQILSVWVKSSDMIETFFSPSIRRNGQHFLETKIFFLKRKTVPKRYSKHFVFFKDFMSCMEFLSHQFEALFTLMDFRMRTRTCLCSFVHPPLQTLWRSWWEWKSSYCGWWARTHRFEWGPKRILWNIFDPYQNDPNEMLYIWNRLVFDFVTGYAPVIWKRINFDRAVILWKQPRMVMTWRKYLIVG